MPGTKSTTLFGLDTVKTWMKVTSNKTDEDDRLTIAADAASEELERNTGVLFVKRTIVETMDGNGKTGAILRNAPVISVASITIGGVLQGASTYYVDLALGVITLLNYQLFPSGQKNVVITYDAGYDIQDGQSLPRDVYRAGLDLTKAIYDELARGAIAVSSITQGPMGTVMRATKYPLSVQRVIEQWKSARIVY